MPPGAIAQVKISLATLSPILNGSLVMDFDPAVFGDVASVAVFSAAGDAYGVATVKGRHLDVRFLSPSSGIGRLRELVENVTPGGGLLPANSVARIEGTGFTPATTVEVAGVSVASVQFIGPQEIDVTLGAPAEMTGKRLRLRNPDGSAVEYFSSLRGVPQGTTSDAKFASIQPLFPLSTYRVIVGGAMVSPQYVEGFALENQNLTAVDVTLEPDSGTWIPQRTTITLPSGGQYVRGVALGLRSGGAPAPAGSFLAQLLNPGRSDLAEATIHLSNASHKHGSNGRYGFGWGLAES